MNEPNDIGRRHREYEGQPLRRADLARDPLDQFAHWLHTVAEGGAKDATAMALATAGPDGAPNVRIVLLKRFDAAGFCWYTDYRSPQGLELAENPQASIAFYWREFNRQVRVRGRVEKLTAETSEQYFNTRPVESRFAAAASVQSAPITNRASLERALARLRRQHSGRAPPRPEQWGGYRLCPREYEFWQGRPGRLHDRFQYVRGPAEDWRVLRLQP